MRYTSLPVITLVATLCGAPFAAQGKMASAGARAKSVTVLPPTQNAPCMSDAEHLQANQRTAAIITQELTQLTIAWGKPQIIRGGRSLSLGYWG